MPGIHAPAVLVGTDFAPPNTIGPQTPWPPNTNDLRPGTGVRRRRVPNMSHGAGEGSTSFVALVGPAPAAPTSVGPFTNMLHTNELMGAATSKRPGEANGSGVARVGQATDRAKAAERSPVPQRTRGSDQALTADPRNGAAA